MRRAERGYLMDTASFFIYCTISTFTPGPTNVVILSTVQRFGARKALNYAYGATLGFGMLLGMSALLNTLLVALVPSILTAMQLIGSGYMLYLAYLLCKRNDARPAMNQAAAFGSGFVMQFLNPKVVIFALTVIPAFIPPSDSSRPALAAGVLTITGIGFAAFISWVAFGSIFRSALQKHAKTVNVVLAGALAYAAVMIWT